MAEQPKKKGLSFAGVKAKIEIVSQSQLRVPEKPVTSKLATQEVVVPEDKQRLPIPRPIATGSRLLFGKKNTKATSGIQVSVAKPMPVKAKPVEKKKVQIVSQPEVKFITPRQSEPTAILSPALEVPSETTETETKSAALPRVKAFFDSLKELYGHEEYEEIELEDIRDSEKNEDDRYFYMFGEDIDEDFTDLNDEFQSIEFQENGFFIDQSDEDMKVADLAHLFDLLREDEDEQEESSEAVEEALNDETEEEVSLSALEEIQENAVLGPLAETILREEGKIPGETLEEKLDDKYKISKPEEGYMPQNRRSFGNFIYQTFKPFELPALPKMADPNACQSVLQSDRSEMYLYQQFVKEYLSWQSPYRGVLVFHGLGSGKTCTSIAAAEALFATSDRKIIVMTPFSLRQNFIGEITTCGFHHFRLKNYWTHFSTSDPMVRLFAKSVLHIPDSHLAKVSRIWVPDFSKEENYSMLTTGEQTEIREQINQIIVYDPAKGLNGRIWFINYNGITREELLKIACLRPNAFDNAVIIVDEIHNLVRIMTGTIEPYLVELGKRAKRKIDYEPIGWQKWAPKLCPKDWELFKTDATLRKKNYKRGYLFYRLLTQATNSKIIGLSGTPIINVPQELGILANVLHGYLQIVEGNVRKAQPGAGSDAQDEATIKKIRDVLSKNLYVDFQDVKKLEKTIQFRVTFLPEGIRKILGRVGVERIPPDEPVVTFEERLHSLESAVEAAGIRIEPASKEMKLKVNTQPLLPPIESDFRDTFLEADSVTLKNKYVLIKRLTGLISYYKGSREDLMPRISRDEDVFVPMSQYQQMRYDDIRNEEIQIEEQKKKQKKEEGVVETAGKLAGLYAEVFELKGAAKSSNYRMASRQLCNFAFPADVNRPKPKTKEEEAAEIGDDKDDILDVMPSDEDKELEERVNEEEREDDADEEANKNAPQEEAPAENENENEDSEEFDEEAARAEAINAGFNEEDVEEYVEMQRNEYEQAKAEAKAAKGLATAQQKRCKAVRLPGEVKYQQRIDRAKECLATSSRDKLLASSTGLGETSPKYLKMLENIRAAPGASLVYSQFLQMEGIGIFALAMDANGYEPIEIKMSFTTKKVYFTERTLNSLKKGPSPDPKSNINQLRYIKFTGEEKDIVRRYALLLFNSKFSELPRELSKPLTDYGWTNNNFGDLCRVFCITSAGAEGLSLKNIRAVHIMEPYWNDVRMAQVKGRAVRICSHAELPPEERTVDVFTYITVFSSESQRARDGIWRISEKVVQSDSLSRDEALKLGLPVPPGVKQYTLTSDQRLWIISRRKKALIDNLQMIMKVSAVDCKLNYLENKESDPAKQFKCKSFAFDSVGDFMYDPDFETDIQKTRLLQQSDNAVKPTTVAAATKTGALGLTAKKPVTVTARVPEPKKDYFTGDIDGKKYIFEPVTNSTGKVTQKYLLYDGTNTEHKKVIGEIGASESKKNPGTYIPKKSTLKLF